jgi:hypothetical protein
MCLDVVTVVLWKSLKNCVQIIEGFMLSCTAVKFFLLIAKICYQLWLKTKCFFYIFAELREHIFRNRRGYGYTHQRRTSTVIPANMLFFSARRFDYINGKDISDANPPNNTFSRDCIFQPLRSPEPVFLKFMEPTNRFQ